MADELDQMGAKRAVELRELAAMEVADIIATANEQGFSASEAIAALRDALNQEEQALVVDPDPAEEDGITR